MSLYQECKARGDDFFVGVPCANLTGCIEDLPADPEVTSVPVTWEGIAVGASHALGTSRIPYPPQEMMARFMAAIRRD